jgi:hypothetical protein
MKVHEKKRTGYEKPQLRQVRLELTETVLTACKLNQSDGTGNGNKGCTHARCKRSVFGS